MKSMVGRNKIKAPGLPAAAQVAVVQGLAAFRVEQEVGFDPPRFGCEFLKRFEESDIDGHGAVPPALECFDFDGFVLAVEVFAGELRDLMDA